MNPELEHDPLNLSCSLCGHGVDPMLTAATYHGIVYCDRHAAEAGYCPDCGDYMGSDEQERESLEASGCCIDCCLNHESDGEAKQV